MATFSCDVHVERFTEKALLVRRVDKKDVPAEWFPKSQIDAESEVGTNAEEGDEGTMIVPEWIAAQKGWI